MAQGDYVIFIQGLVRSEKSMKKMMQYLNKKGYKVINKKFPTGKYSIVNLAKYLDEIIVKNCKSSTRKIHFVTHSLGGIIVRYYLKERELKNLGRVVMLGPPNQGSEVTDLWQNFFLYKWIFGPAGQEIGTSSSSTPIKLGPVSFPLGVIAGTGSLDLFHHFLIPRPNDGKVPIERTKVEGMTDFIIVNRSHSLIMNGKEVLQQTEHFLRKGYFMSENIVHSSDSNYSAIF